jgi:hypothetical protein
MTAYNVPSQGMGAHQADPGVPATAAPAGPGGSSPVGEDERERAVRRLQEAYAEGRLSHLQLEEGLHAALTATTGGELAAALAMPVPRPREEGAGSGVAGGRIVRRGAWRVPRVLTVVSALGGVRLDLSRAVIEHPEVDIALHLGTGGAHVTVPRDAVVDLTGLRTGWKAPLYAPPRRRRPGGPVIRLTGTVGLGRIRVRHARR